MAPSNNPEPDGSASPRPTTQSGMPDIVKRLPYVEGNNSIWDYIDFVLYSTSSSPADLEPLLLKNPPKENVGLDRTMEAQPGDNLPEEPSSNRVDAWLSTLPSSDGNPDI